MTFMLLLCLTLTIMSYFSSTLGTFSREFVFELNTFQTPHYFLGIMSEDMGCEDQIVTRVTVGLILLNFHLYTYRHTEGTIKQYPFLDDEGLFPGWQKLLYRFLHSLDIPIPGKKKDA